MNWDKYEEWRWISRQSPCYWILWLRWFWYFFLRLELSLFTRLLGKWRHWVVPFQLILPMRTHLRFLKYSRAWELCLASSIFWSIQQRLHTLCGKRRDFHCPALGNSSLTSVAYHQALWLPRSKLLAGIFLHWTKSRFGMKTANHSVSQMFSKYLQK